MALIVLAAVEAAVEVGMVAYRLLAKPAQQLPALRDLAVMTASNGAPIPFGYGTCRVPGNVIWTPGIEYFPIGKNQGGANLAPKGGYVYYAQLAVAFGEGPGIISRIWGDSKLIYNANPGQSNAVPVTDWPAWDDETLYNPGNQVNSAGQIWQAIEANTNSLPSQANRNWLDVSPYPAYSFDAVYFPGDLVVFSGQLWLCQIGNNNKSVGGDVDIVIPGLNLGQTINGAFVYYWIPLNHLYPAPVIYPGDNNQLPDSTVQASEGASLTPAFRGLIYCVFGGLYLGNFANRIPNLRAEITYTKVASLL